jgi:hypothetical protein
MNNKMLSRPEAFYPVPRQAALAYYAENPIRDHVQCLPPLKTTILVVDGERVWTSAKEVAELEEILVRDLVWPKRHVGELSRFHLSVHN